MLNFAPVLSKQHSMQVYANSSCMIQADTCQRTLKLPHPKLSTRKRLYLIRNNEDVTHTECTVW